MWVCKHCNGEFDFDTTAKKANHSRWCTSNPKHQQFIDDNRNQSIRLAEKRFGIFKDFEVTCKCCSNVFIVNERENLFPTKDQYFCSSYCAHHRGSGEEWASIRNEDLKGYATICFAYHKKECIICGEQNIVEVHHFDEDHDNNDPSNLIPLCPTHHQYWHSRYKYMIETVVTDYHKRFSGV